MGSKNLRSLSNIEHVWDMMKRELTLFPKSDATIAELRQRMQDAWDNLLRDNILHFFNWLFIVALTARSYRDWHWFSVLGMVLYWYFWNSAVTNYIFSLSMADIYRAVSIVTWPRLRCEQPWAQATPSIMRGICRTVSSVVTGPYRRYQSWDQATPSMSYCMSSNYTAICWGT